LFIIEVVDEEDDGLSPTDGEPTISIHALTGIQPRTSRTMTIMVAINNAHLLALLDFGSTHNFIDSTMAFRAGVVLARLSSMCVVVTNSDKLLAFGSCRNMEFVVHGEHFQIDCYNLSLGSYDKVLGVQWLESLEPILWDFRRGTLVFVHNGHCVLWIAATSGSMTTMPPSLLSAKGELMEEMLHEFSPLFQEPTGLPLAWNRTHHIHLLPGMTSIVV
jgi:hypothetical protein